MPRAVQANPALPQEVEQQWRVIEPPALPVAVGERVAEQLPGFPDPRKKAGAGGRAADGAPDRCRSSAHTERSLGTAATSRTNFALGVPNGGVVRYRPAAVTPTL